MKKKATMKQIVKEYFLTKTGQTVYTYNIETELPTFGQVRYGVLHTGGSYSRIWRSLRYTKLPFTWTEVKNKLATGWQIWEIPL